MFAVLIFLAAALVTVLSISNVNHDEKSPIKQVAETNSTALQQDDGDTSNETSTSTISLDFAVPEIDTIEWLTYRDSVLEIEFKYPNTWPEPVIRTNIPKNITWALDVGPLGKGFCEGSDCYVYHLSGKSGGDYELERQRIKNEGSTIFSDVLREDGVRVIRYTADGICSELQGLMLYKNTSVAFGVRCGMDDPEKYSIHNTIIENFKFLETH